MMEKCVYFNYNNDMSLNIQKAIIFATMHHQNQKRKGTDIPYIVHPMEVMFILTDMQCPEPVIIAGILHDTLEDTNATAEDIAKLFGDDVLQYVLTESEDKSKTWKERKQTTIERLKSKNRETVLVNFADKLSNIRSMYRDSLEVGAKLWERFNADKDSIEWYYRSMIDAFSWIQFDEHIRHGKEYFDEYVNTINMVFRN